MEHTADWSADRSHGGWQADWSEQPTCPQPIIRPEQPEYNARELPVWPDPWPPQRMRAPRARPAGCARRAAHGTLTLVAMLTVATLAFASSGGIPLPPLPPLPRVSFGGPDTQASLPAPTVTPSPTATPTPSPTPEPTDTPTPEPTVPTVPPMPTPVLTPWWAPGSTPWPDNTAGTNTQSPAGTARPSKHGGGHAHGDD